MAIGSRYEINISTAQLVAPGITRNKKLLVTRAILLVTRTLLLLRKVGTTPALQTSRDRGWSPG